MQSDQASAPTTPIVFIGRKEVMRRTDLSYPHIWRMMCAKEFPVAKDVGIHAKWIEAEVDAWCRSRVDRVYRRGEGEALPAGTAKRVYRRAK